MFLRHITLHFNDNSQADCVSFVNEYLVSAGPLTRRMLCVAQSLEHARTSEFSAVASSQPGAAASLFDNSSDAFTLLRRGHHRR
jgi:hypothetical protein